MENVTHTVHFATRINQAGDKATSRYALGNVHVSPRSAGGAWLCATDGRIMAVVADDKATCPSPALAPLSVVTGATATRPVVATLNGRWENSKGKAADKAAGRFPDVPHCLPEALPEFTPLRIDAALLASLAAAITAVGESSLVTLFVPTGRGKGDYVDGAIPVVGATGVGVLMPVGTGREWEQNARLDATRYNETRQQFVTDFKRVD